MSCKVREVRGVWRVVVDFKGRRVSRNVGQGREGKRAAQDAAEKIQAKLALGDLSSLESPTPPTPTVAPPRFAALAAEWLARAPVVRNLRPGTLDNYRSFVTHHLIPTFGEVPVTAITTDAVEAFIAAKLGATGSTRFPGRPLSRGSLRVGLVALRCILRRAVRRGLIPANPVADLEARFPRVDDERVDPFTTADLRAILAAAERRAPDFAALIRLWAQTGLRAGEVCGLQWQDVDLDRGTALVRRTWSRGRIGPVKTGRSRVVSLLHPTLEDAPEWRPGALAGAWAVVDVLRRLRVRSLVPEAFVFGGPTPIPSYRLHADWRRVLTAAGVRYREPEQLRHGWASTLLSRNAPLLYVQKQGGWRSATVLLRVYARWLPQDGEAVPARPAATPAQPPAFAAAGV